MLKAHEPHLFREEITIMRRTVSAIITTLGVAGLVGPAFGTDMTGAEITAFVSGNTIYLETTAASASGKPGQGVIYWAADGTALYKTSTGALWHGTWKIKDNTACTEWKEKPSNDCVRYDRTADTVSVIDAASGQTRAKVVKTASGNAENLKP